MFHFKKSPQQALSISAQQGSKHIFLSTFPNILGCQSDSSYPYILICGLTSLIQWAFCTETFLKNGEAILGQHGILDVAGKGQIGERTSNSTGSGEKRQKPFDINLIMDAGWKENTSLLGSLGLTKTHDHDISVGFDSSLVQKLILGPTMVRFYSIQINKYFWSPFACEVLQRTQSEISYTLKIVTHINGELTICQCYHKNFTIINQFYSL